MLMTPPPSPHAAGGGAQAWSTAQPDWKARIAAKESLIPALPLDEAKADRAERIFRNLRVPDIEGTPTYGEVCGPWVIDLVRAIFGAFDIETGLRMVREYFVAIPKKNGKTSIAAAIIVVAMLLNERPKAEALLIAPTQRIAEMSFAQAAGIIALSTTPSGTPLAALFTVHAHIKTIRYLRPDVPCEMVIKAADADVITGSKASIVLIDETHVFATNRNADGIFVEIRGGLSHPQNKGFLLQITTQSKDVPRGVFRQELRRARAVRDGELVASLLPVIYELPPEVAARDGWKDPATWSMVNPHLGRSVDAGYLADELSKAEADGFGALALFASQHLNVEIGQSLSGDAWDGARHWQQCAAKGGLTLDQLLAQSEVVVIGIDWGGADDLASLAVIGRSQYDKGWLHWQQSWARPSVLEQRKAIAPALMDFVACGDLALVETGEEQAEQCADLCARIAASGKLPDAHAIGLDSAGVALLIDALQARGLTEPRVEAVAQGWKLQTAISTLPLKLEDRRLRHGNQPMMAWAVGNAKQELKGSNYVVTKQAAGAAKIDPLMATFNAAMLMFLNPQVAAAPRIRIA
ncbi:MAG: terminase large subunit [Beijerinckiaceae bacterium]